MAVAIAPTAALERPGRGIGYDYMRYPVEVLGRLVGRVGRRNLNAGVVECHVQPAEGRDRTLDHGGGLVLVGYITGDAQRLMAGGGQLVGGGTKRLVVDVGEDNGGARIGEGLGGGKPHPGAGPGDQGDLAVKS